MKFFMAASQLLNILVFSLTLTAVGAVPASDANIPAEVINLAKIGLVTHINVFITLESLVTNLVSVNFDVQNPLLIELTVDRVTNQAGVNNTVFAEFDQSFKKFVVPPLGSANSGTFGNVTLTQGATASLAIVPLQSLDIISADVFLRAATILGFGGISVPLLGIEQKNINTTYSLDLTD